MISESVRRTSERRWALSAEASFGPGPGKQVDSCCDDQGGSTNRSALLPATVPFRPRPADTPLELPPR
jgi:hypothetical protein